MADINQKWEMTDAITDVSLPRARLVKACHENDNEWIVECILGGFAPENRIVKVQKMDSTWRKISDDTVKLNCE